MSAVVVAARRTALRSVRAHGRAAQAQTVYAAEDLAACVLAAVAADLRSSGFEDPDEVLLGSARPAPGNVARRAALAAGLGIRVGAASLDRQCGSGLDAVRWAAALSAQEDRIVLAGGVESVSESGPAQSRFVPDGFADPDLAEAADALAVVAGISRQRQDAYIARSYAYAARAAQRGDFADELVAGPWGASDDRPRDLNPAILARLTARYGQGGMSVAGIAGVADGAAALALVPLARWRRHRVPGLRLRGSAVVGVDPAQPGIAAAIAIEEVLRRNGVEMPEIRLVEIVEAFAAQQLACLDRLGLDPFGLDADRVCPQGGALGLGHPWGASGAISVVRVFTQLVRARAPMGSLAVSACAVAGGQGVAVLWEVVG